MTVRHVSCAECFGAYLDPVYTSAGFSVLFDQADQSYGAHGPARNAEPVEWMQRRGVLSAGTRLLDVGCYEGEFLRALPDDIEPMGVDADRHAIARARARLGPRAILIAGDLESFEIPAQPDVITMFHVLEHVRRPVQALARLRELAHDRTYLVVEVPVLEGRPTNDLVGFFSPCHTTHFSRHSLVQCLAAAGWKVVDRSAHDEYNGETVLCTAADPVAHVSGDHEDMARIQHSLSLWHGAVADVTARLTDRLGGQQRCLIWGAGLHVEQLYAATTMFRLAPEREYLLVDSDPTKQGRTWRGMRILPPSALQEPECRDVPLVISSYGSQEEIADAARELGVDRRSIVTLYETVDAR